MIAQGTFTTPHTLYCLPHAGGSAHGFSAMKHHLPSSIRLIPIDYPGHGSRAAEPLLYNLEAIAENLLAAHDLPDEGFSLLGHSMGAFVAWLMAQILCRSGKLPGHLFVSARQPPCLSSNHFNLHRLNDTDFIHAIQVYGGVPQEIVEDPSALAFFLPILRADFAAVENWNRPLAPSRLPLAISAFCGEKDVTTSPGAMQTWSEYSNVGFSHACFEGGHFYLFENPEPVCTHIAQVLNVD